MKFNKLSYVAALAGGRLVMADEEVHGQGAEGTEMGPVAFLWPADRPWSASSDNVAPCGSSSGVSNRTSFPLSQGSVALSIADDAWSVAFSIAYDNDPTDQSDFSQQVVSNVTAIEPGHQCYKVADIPDTVESGTNATIQLEYWSNMDNELGGRNQSFFACADITFVEATSFDIQVPCFNVTSSDFNLPESSSTASATAVPSATGGAATTESTSASDSSSSSSNDFGSGLSSGAKAGVAVGVIVVSLAIVGGIAFVVLRRRRTPSAAGQEEAGARAAKSMREVPSVSSLRH
ncbi:gpi anchored protein [Eutypa lata UCREL1]|uniref:Gpi anchored protein n=1 Tax=Eutypa lata (strain UCR-EL1) TaxID=1287681 RepID=M7SXM5_EUTLA|nr:gpi anchored protein [Eutypa lata UCREL1]